MTAVPFTLTGVAQRETLTVTNLVMFTPEYVATRRATLFLDNLGDGELRFRGLGATGKTYRFEATPELISPVWTPLGNATADGNGRFTYFSSQVSGAPHAVLPSRRIRSVALLPVTLSLLV